MWFQIFPPSQYLPYLITDAWNKQERPFHMVHRVNMLIPLEGWEPKNWCFQTAALEKILGSPLDYKEIKPVNPKGNQPWISIGRTDAEAEAPTLWCKEPNHWKRPWYWERLKAKGEGSSRGLDGYHHQLNGHEFEQTLGDSGGQRSLVCRRPRDHKELATT